jgi:hypothetical protein
MLQDIEKAKAGRTKDEGKRMKDDERGMVWRPEERKEGSRRAQ